ncbi:MAG: 6-phosphogluconolactonase [Halioglobus sp.]|jgi:6-phosphogluconolactonase
MSNQFYQFESNVELAVQLANTIALDLEEAINTRGKATLAVSGGSTPVALFEQLSQRTVDWAHITVTQVDERWVDAQHEDANARLIREHLLQNAAAAANFVSMKTAAASPFGAEAAAAEKLSAFSNSIDVVVLGMGNDGHTASFFPAATTLAQALDPAGSALCVALTPPSAPHDRMTLSLPALLRAQHLYLHIVGETKMAVLQQARLPGKIEDLPIRSVMAQAEPSLHIYYANRN